MAKRADSSRKAFRPLAFLLLAALFLLILFIALLPSALSTERGRRFALNCINGSIHGELSIESWKLSWLGGQKIDNLTLKDCEGHTVFSFVSFSSTASLFTLPTGLSRFSRTELVQPTLNLERDNFGQLNVEKIFEREEPNRAKKRSVVDSKSLARKIRGRLNLCQGTINYRAPHALDIQIQDIVIETDPKLKQVHITATSREADQIGSIALVGTFESRKSALKIDLVKLPTRLLDQLENNRLISAAIGPLLDLKLVLEEQAGRVVLQSEFQSSNLDGKIIAMEHEGSFTFDPASKVNFALTPNLFNQLFRKSKWRLANRADFAVTLKEIHLPVIASRRKAVETPCLPFAADLCLERAELVHEKLGNLSINDLKIVIAQNRHLDIDYSGAIQSKDGLAKLSGRLECQKGGLWSYYSNFQDMPTALSELYFEDSERINSLIGPRFSMISSGQLTSRHFSSNFSLTTALVTMEGNLVGEDSSYKLKGCGCYLFDKKWAPFFGASSNFNLDAEIEDQEVGLVIPRLALQFRSPLLEADVRGSLGERGFCFTLDKSDLVITGALPYSEERLFFRSAGFYAHFDGVKNELGGTVEIDGRASEIDCANVQFKVENLIQNNGVNWQGLSAEFEADGQVASSLICWFFRAENLPCEVYLGKKLSLDIAGCRQGGKTNFLVRALGTGLEITLPLELKESGELVLKEPAQIFWRLNEERLEAIEKVLRGREGRYRLVEESEIAIVLSELKLPSFSFEAARDELPSLSGKLWVESSAIKLRDCFNDKPLTFNDIKFSLASDSLAQSLQGNFQTSFSAESIPQEAESKAEINFLLSAVMDQAGNWVHPSTISLKAFSDHLPVKEMTSLLVDDDDEKIKIDALLGDLLNAIIQIDLAGQKGNLRLDMKATNFKAFLPLYYENGWITLTDQVDAELTLTPEINAIFLKDLNPLFITGAFSNHPLRLFIQKEGFSCFVKPFQIELVRIEKGVLDLGKILVKNGGQVHALMEFLKAEKLSQEELMEAWFTPIFFTLKDGVLNYSRVDVLLGGSVHIAFWGGIDLAHDRVQMTLGISPTNLRKRFNIAGLSKKDLFQVKMRGSPSNLELDWSSAYTRIGILIARTAGGGIGYIVGGIIEQLVEAFGEEPSPPATTQPFPWESTQPPESQASNIMPVMHEDDTSLGAKSIRRAIEFLIP